MKLTEGLQQEKECNRKGGGTGVYLHNQGLRHSLPLPIKTEVVGTRFERKSWLTVPILMGNIGSCQSPDNDSFVRSAGKQERGITDIMNNLSHDSDGNVSVPVAHERAKKSLREFFQQKSVKSLVSVLVPSALAAVLFPIFGPAVAGAAAIVAAKNGLKALNISLSTETIEKIMNPLQGKQVEEDDVKEVLDDLLKSDKKVNEEATQVVVSIVPEVKDAALENPKLDQDWLGQSLETSLKEQGGKMAQLAPAVRKLTALEGEELLLAIARMKESLLRQEQIVTASDDAEISDSEQNIHGQANSLSQQIRGSERAKIIRVKQNFTQN